MRNLYVIYTTRKTVCYPVILPVPKDVKQNTTYFFIMKIHNIQEPQQIAINHSSDTGFDEFKRLYRKCTADPY